MTHQYGTLEGLVTYRMVKNTSQKCLWLREHTTSCESGLNNKDFVKSIPRGLSQGEHVDSSTDTIALSSERCINCQSDLSGGARSICRSVHGRLR